MVQLDVHHVACIVILFPHPVESHHLRSQFVHPKEDCYIISIHHHETLVEVVKLINI